MQEKVTWHELDQRFASISDPHLRADVTYVFGSGQSGSWLLVNGRSESTTLRFRVDAELAGELLAPGSGDPFTIWLDALKDFCIRTHSKKLSPSIKEVNEDGTFEGRRSFRTIQPVCEASANFCCWLEATSAKDTSGTSAVRNAATSTTEPATASVHPAPGARTTRGRNRGPKPDHDAASLVADIVVREVPNGDWHSKLDVVCEALDAAGVPMQSIAGHLSKKMLDHYSHVRMAAKRSAVESLGALCANMTETSSTTVISEQGGKENQHDNDERFCPACNVLTRIKKRSFLIIWPGRFERLVGV